MIIQTRAPDRSRPIALAAPASDRTIQLGIATHIRYQSIAIHDRTIPIALGVLTHDVGGLT